MRKRAEERKWEKGKRENEKMGEIKMEKEEEKVGGREERGEGEWKRE